MIAFSRHINDSHNQRKNRNERRKSLKELLKEYNEVEGKLELLKKEIVEINEKIKAGEKNDLDSY